jgi:hypothetical protein
MRQKRDKDREKELFDASFGEVTSDGQHRHVFMSALRQEGLQVPTSRAPCSAAARIAAQRCFRAAQTTQSCAKPLVQVFSEADESFG